MDELDIFNYTVALEADFRAAPERMPPAAYVLAETIGRGQLRPVSVVLPGAEDVSTEEEVTRLLEHHIHSVGAIATGLAMAPTPFMFIGVQIALHGPRFDLDVSDLTAPERLSSVAIGHHNGNLYAAHHNLNTGITTTRRYVRDDLHLRLTRRALGLAQILKQTIDECRTNHGWS